MNSPDFQLHWIDYAIVGVYFIGVLAHGLYVGKGKETSEDYFLAGKNLPWYLIGFSLFASNMSGSSFVGLMGGTYAEGVAVFNYEWTAALVLLFFAAFILPSYLRAGVYTVPEFLERRFDVKSRRAFSLFTILAIMFIDTAGALYAGGLVITQAMPFLQLWMAVAILALVAGIYTIMGGLSAVVVTDTVQAILLIIGAAIIFVIGLNEVGGWSALVEATSPDKLQLIKPADDDFLPWPGLWGVILLGFYYWAINQFVVQRTLGAKDLNQGRLGAVFAGFLKIPNLFLMIMPGIIALALYPDLDNPDLAFPSLAFDLLPIGLRGLIAAALIAAIMSSLDSALNAASTLVTMDFIKPLRPQTEDKTLVIIGRFVTGGAVLVGAIYAPMIASFESLFEYFQSSLSYIVPPIVTVYVFGIFWKGLTAPAAFITIMFGIGVGVPIFILKEVTDVWASWNLPDIHYTIMSSIMMLIAIVSCLLISKTTSRRDDEEVGTIAFDRGNFDDDLAQVKTAWYADWKVQGAALVVVTAGSLALYI